MKEAQQLNILQRISKLLSVETRHLIFKYFIQSNINYCPLVLHFCSEANTDKFKKQYRAHRIVLCLYLSFESLLSKVILPTLHMNILRCLSTETYKFINNISPEYLRDLVVVKQTHYSFPVNISTVRIVTYEQRSFRVESVHVWNSLHNEPRTATSYWEFKGLICTWVGLKCNCAICGSLEGQASKLCFLMLCFMLRLLCYAFLTICNMLIFCLLLLNDLSSFFLNLLNS